MYQGYGQQPVRAPQGFYPMQNQAPMLKGRPVSSLEEVRATGIDFDGSISYFPDIANKRIYTKQIGMDGTAILTMYEQKPIPQEVPVGAYITREEFETAMKALKEEMRQPHQETVQTSSDDSKADSPQFNF